jgi:O-antigen/teichoic acid export membrane protein
MTITKIFSSKLLGQENNKQIVYSKIVSMVTFTVGILLLSPEFGILGLAISYLLSTIFEAVCLIPLKNSTHK